jgi:DNA-binding CsgD family transcriptional regulator
MRGIAPLPKVSCWAELTPRQREIGTLVMVGKSTREIARILDCSPNTVRVHRAAIADRLPIENRGRGRGDWLRVALKALPEVAPNAAR